MKKLLLKFSIPIMVLTIFAGSTATTFAWGPSTHRSCVTQGASTSGISLGADEKKALLAGSVFPDEDGFTYTYGKGPLHGDLWNKYKNGYNANYIGNYIYLTQIAVLLGNNKSVKKGTLSQKYGIYNNDIATLDGYVTYSTSTKAGKVGGKTWSTIFKEIGISNTAANRKAFVYGVALHEATDTFAHSTWTTDSTGVWARITHASADYGIHNTSKKIGADYTTYKPGRLMAAKEVGKNIITSYKSGKAGKVSDFIVSDNCFKGVDGKYRIGNYAYYAYVSGKTTGESTIYKQFFKGDLAYQCSTNKQKYRFYDHKEYNNWW